MSSKHGSPPPAHPGQDHPFPGPMTLRRLECPETSPSPPRPTPIAPPPRSEKLALHNNQAPVLSPPPTSSVSPSASFARSPDPATKVASFSSQPAEEPPTRRLQCHTGRIHDIAMAADKNLLATTSSDMLVRLWDPVTGALLHTLERWPECSRATAICPDVRYLVSAQMDGTILVLDCSMISWPRAMPRSLGGRSGSINALDISPDGKTIAAGCENKTVQLWDLESGVLQRTFAGHPAAVTAVAFSTDGCLVASGSGDGKVRIWRTATTFPVAIETYKQHSSAVTAVVFSPGDEFLASGHENGNVVLWNRHKSTAVRSILGYSAPITALRFSPDATQLVSASRDTYIRVWDIPRSMSECVLTGHTDIVSKVKFSPDGRLLGSGSRDRTGRIWDLATGKEIHKVTNTDDPVDDLVFSADGSQITMTEFGLSTWNLNPWRWAGRHQTGYFYHSICMSPHGEILATGVYSKLVRIWCCSTGRLLRSLDGHQSRTTAMAFSSDGKFLATGSVDTTVVVWKIRSGKIITRLRGHEKDVLKVSFASDGNLLASASADGSVRVWDTKSGTTVRILDAQGSYHDSPHSFDFTADCDWAVARSYSHGLRIWQSRYGALQHTEQESGGDMVRISPDAMTVVTTSDRGRDGVVIRMWKLTTGKLLGILEGHRTHVTDLVFSPNSRRLASSSMDGSVRLWDVESRTLLRVLRGSGWGLHALAFCSEGKMLVAGSSGGDVFIWKVD
ncbi:hypothetical protein ASPCAL09390 [Aspergillus calidoustus]|uniref:Uncharacterized protein n=1 Tax=Aspergillus calidoustus TaxID=454130 RepID=A0A0U5GV28_ASPCI|nr:hypothetical protein ASPCAL09390 [Aspergillus calidoustus]